jgi:hypothetical protein
MKTEALEVLRRQKSAQIAENTSLRDRARYGAEARHEKGARYNER